MHFTPRCRRNSDLVLNKALERVLTVLLLVPALPVMAIAWLLVKLTSPGPGLYRQRRSGQNGRQFFIYKLRTMSHGCERNTGAVWAQPNDPRVTPLGHILRKTHIDELPQLFNVLRGDMALVGPRPERPEIIEQLLPEVPNYAERLHLRPGVTGLAQIQAGPDRTISDVRRKLRYDFEYATSMSVWLDARIIACTAMKMIGLNRPWLRSILLPKPAIRQSESAPHRERRFAL